eukprot:542841-Pyramimonas_sp.AAC.1
MVMIIENTCARAVTGERAHTRATQKQSSKSFVAHAVLIPSSRPSRMSRARKRSTHSMMLHVGVK